MCHRSVVAVGIVVALFLNAAPAPGGGQKDKTPAVDAHRAAFDKCAKACSDCQRQCASCATHCANLIAEGKKEHKLTLKSCLDCADVCTTAAQIVSRQGPLTGLICKTCADACNHCGKACEKHKTDEHMRRCAEECFRCEKACRDMMAHVTASQESTGSVERTE